MRFTDSLAVTFAAFGVADAWWLQVHNQIAFTAEQMINNNTKYMVSQILESKYGGSIGRAASWADTVRKTPYPFSYGWHFISAQDNPPQVCSLDYERDCQEGGCVVQQIANQTEILEGCIDRVAKGEYTADIDCQNALKWVVHFIGDVAQPLHASDKAYGGNTIKVTFNGTASNLHETWDRWILYAGTNRPGGFPDDKIDPYFSSLALRIDADAFKIPRGQWDMCDWDVFNGTRCPEQWAKDTNKLACSYVYSELGNGTKDLYLSGYAEGAFPLVEFQLAKAAWRMAGWLNRISDKHLGDGHDRIKSTGNDRNLQVDGAYKGKIFAKLAKQFTLEL